MKELSRTYFYANGFQLKIDGAVNVYDVPTPQGLSHHVWVGYELFEMTPGWVSVGKKYAPPAPVVLEPIVEPAESPDPERI